MVGARHCRQVFIHAQATPSHAFSATSKAGPALTEHSMSEVTKEAIEAAIKEYEEPHLGRDLVGAGCVKGIEIEGDQVKVAIVLGFPAKGAADAVAAAVKAPCRLSSLFSGAAPLRSASSILRIARGISRKKPE